MHKVPTFEIYEEERSTNGVFNWGDDKKELSEAYYNASDLYFSGEVDKALDILEDIINQNEHFIDAYNLLGTIQFDQGNPDKGKKLHNKGLQIGKKIIPESFEGNIRWGFTENRPFLRSLHSVALNHAYDGNYKQSIELFEQILDYNPDDNQGVRYLIGDLYFLQNNFTKAKQFYADNLDYPPYLYSYGLMQYALGNYIKAITYLRKGILNNIYISDILLSKQPIIPYQIWHASNYEMPETAYSYLEFMTFKWINYPDALELLDFLFAIEPSSSEIGETYFLKNELTFTDSGFDALNDEESFNRRKELLDKIEKMKKQISESSSKKIFKSWKKEIDSSFPGI
jgi:tetratricopeptide (TPR) repeat protein